MPNNFVDFNHDCTLENFAMQMFENTSDDGKLYLNNWYDVDCEDCLTYNNFLAEIHWDSKAFDHIMDYYKSLVAELTEISKHYDELGGNILESHLKARRVLHNEWLISTYFIFVAPFTAKNSEQLKTQVYGRVGEGVLGYELIRHSQRLCKLLSLNAPDSVILRECKYLFASCAIHHCASSIEKLNNN